MKSVKKIIFIKLPLALILLSVLWVVILRWVPVYYTPLMLKRSVQYSKDEDFRTRKKWVSLEKISPDVIKAVVASEDNRFFEHKGFDYEEIKKMLAEHNERGTKLRGCSTISQQTAKNVFTWCSDTWIRKAVEAYYAFLIENIWGKKRIMEVYLNVAEMGKGIYGAEAASGYYFNKKASQLSRREAISLAVILPTPLRSNPAKPSSYLNGRIGQISARMYQIAYPDWIGK
ncbi:MAG: monofunctional biosynthetic peptidoglycan transglycosylase [Bacteroidales bacterium]|nr:monofunctional biosynthetic peptidoglycan transglycosylase [Bacteroidales bacterium]